MAALTAKQTEALKALKRGAVEVGPGIHSIEIDDLGSFSVAQVREALLTQAKLNKVFDNIEVDDIIHKAKDYITTSYCKTQEVVALPGNRFKVVVKGDSLMTQPIEMVLPTELALKFLPLGKDVRLWMFGGN